jgi:hypothetical protein
VQTLVLRCIYFSTRKEKNKEKNMGEKLRLDRDRYGHMPLLRQQRDYDPEDFFFFFFINNKQHVPLQV